MNVSEILRDVLENDEINDVTRSKLEGLQTAYNEQERQHNELSDNFNQLKKRYYDRFFSGDGDGDDVNLTEDDTTPAYSEGDKIIEDIIFNQ